MQILFRKEIFFILTIGLLTFSSCYTSVKSIQKKPDKYQGKKVVIKGEVVSSLDLMDINCFTIKDKDRHMLVVTDNLLPLKRDKIKVKGVVEKNYKYKKRILLVLIEKKMKLRKPPKFKKIKEKMPK